jgi:hypothetical protein
MAREAVDKHLQVAGVLVDPDASPGAKLRALPRIGAFYAWWYPTRWLPRGAAWRYRELGRLAKHARFIERHSRKLARQVFHGMLVHRAALEHKQAFLFRLVDIAMEMFAMTAAISRAATMADRHEFHAEEAIDLADAFCRMARRRVGAWFRALWRNDDARRYALARDVLEGRHAWVEHGAMPLGLTAEDLAPKPLPAPAPTNERRRAS